MTTPKKKETAAPKAKKAAPEAAKEAVKETVKEAVKETVKPAAASAEQPKKKPGRPAGSKNKTKKAAPKKAAAPANAPTVYVQYHGSEALVSELVDRVRADFKEKFPAASIRSMNLYIKPEDGACYYVINKYSGRIAL